jgi:hypothetical protein
MCIFNKKVKFSTVGVANEMIEVVKMTTIAVLWCKISAD